MRCIACNKRVPFGDDLCRSCQTVVAEVYIITPQDELDMEDSICTMRLMGNSVRPVEEELEYYEPGYEELSYAV